MAALVLSLFLVLIPILVPAGAFIQLVVRGQNESIVINSDGVRNVAKRFPIFIVWKRVLWIIAWSGDVLLLTFGGGVLIPRHAFRTSYEADDFINAVRQFRRKARQNG
ncbi:MAG: hypothetical protein EOO01_29765 [Chitinophagaceae bacterium]|nr:MAG: hypothetical protein EOO01_29765 [Chitinophagaceae bacterium]